MKFNYLIAATLAIAAGTVQAHAKLEASEPKASSTQQGAPKVLRLRFNEALEPAFSKVTLRDAANRDIALPKAAPDKAHTKEMTVPLPPLAVGDYRVLWSAVTHDGHKTKGEFTFRVK